VDGTHVFETLSHLALQFGNTSGAHFSNEIGVKIRIIILDLVRGSNAVGYIPEVLSASLSALTGGRIIGILQIRNKSKGTMIPLSMFLNSEELVLPFYSYQPGQDTLRALTFLEAISCSRCMHKLLWRRRLEDNNRLLDWIPSFTQILPDDFSAYENNA